jgi:hypothetical protein
MSLHKKSVLSRRKCLAGVREGVFAVLDRPTLLVLDNLVSPIETQRPPVVAMVLNYFTQFSGFLAKFP